MLSDMSGQNKINLSENEANALLGALGNSIDQVLETTNSVKIKGLGVFRKTVNGIEFKADDVLTTEVNADFEHLDIVRYDPSDLARSHLKREEFTFEEELASKAKQTEVVASVIVEDVDDFSEAVEIEEESLS